MSKLWARIVFALVLTAGVTLGSSVGRADEGQVDLLLVLAADVSRSVDDREFRLQREGFATAIVEPRVLRAITNGPIGRIAVVFVEWASEFEQKIIVDWAVIGGEGDAQAVSERIRAAPRSYWGRTSISGAIDFSMALLARSPFQASRRVIDISGDGTNNSGIDVSVSRDGAIAKDVTINGLVILSDEPLPTNPTHTHPPGGLTGYYERNVMGGPGAFVVEAQGFESFGEALIRKLIKEIAALVPESRIE
jgi:Protein of unknown function (DUF1194)